MSDDKNELDDFLKRKMNSKQFEFKESYWNDAKKIINENRGGYRQKNRILFLLSMATVAMISIGFFFMDSFHELSHPNPRATAYTENASTSDASGQIIHTSNSDIDQVDGAVSSMVIEKRESSLAMEMNHIGADEKSTLSGAADKVKITSPSVIEKATTRKGSPTFTMATISSSSDRHATSEIPVKPKKNKQSIIDESLEIPGEQTMIVEGRTLAYPYAISGHFYNPNKAEITLSDSLNKKRIEYIQSHLKQKQQRFLTLEAGLNAYNPSGSISNAVNLQAGFRYYYHVSSRFGLNAGLMYSRIHQDLPERTYENISYSFGQTISTTQIKTLLLDYVELPVNGYFNVFSKHYITAGASIGYLIQSTERIITQTDTETQKQDNGHKQPINPYNVQLNAGYLLFLPKGFNVSVGYYYGLSDVSKNDWFKSNQFNRNSGVRIAIGYRLF